MKLAPDVYFPRKNLADVCFKDLESRDCGELGVILRFPNIFSFRLKHSPRTIHREKIKIPLDKFLILLDYC
jgi:hypothetical protein